MNFDGSKTRFYKIAGFTALLENGMLSIHRLSFTVIQLVFAVLVGSKILGKRGSHVEIFGMKFVSYVLVLNVLFSPYLPIYDVSLLLPAMLWLAARLSRLRFPTGDWLVVGLWLGPHLGQAMSHAWQVPITPFLLSALYVAAFSRVTAEAVSCAHSR